jgi:hypothetical protein
MYADSVSNDYLIRLNKAHYTHKLVCMYTTLKELCFSPNQVTAAKQALYVLSNSPSHTRVAHTGPTLANKPQHQQYLDGYVIPSKWCMCPLPTPSCLVQVSLYWLNESKEQVLPAFQGLPHLKFLRNPCMEHVDGPSLLRRHK